MRIQKAMLFGARDLRFVEEEIEASRPGIGEVVVTAEITALSTGTDLGNYEGRSTEVPGAPDYPRSVGYSHVGTVTAAGQGAEWKVGERVFSTRPHQSAYLAGAGELLVSVPEGVDPAGASLAYLTQLGMAGMRQARYEAGERVAVIGLGVIGLCTVAVAAAMGARVTAIGNSPFRNALATAMGAGAAITSGDAEVENLKSDLVVLTANPWAAYRDAIAAARHGGRISILGFPGRAQAPPGFNPLDASWLYAKQLTLMGSGFSPRTAAEPHEVAFNLRRNLELIFDYMRSGRLPLERIITHRMPWREMRDAYDLALGRSKEMAAAVFEWGI
ncbi:MAG: zinc-binding alcohol dehydrogenase [Bryobacterales bacterium]|nr:zinc-binding alcohol dehydrogenase [Bryobacterales bacterium]